MQFTSKNILDYYHQATQVEYSNGRLWYLNAHHQCEYLAIKHSLPLNKVIGMTAALSPRNRWSRNLIDVENLLSHAGTFGINSDDIYDVKVATFNGNKIKAINILQDTSDVDMSSHLGGSKVISFYRCILNPSGQDVCLDGHSIAVASGTKRITGLSLSGKHYLNLAALYVEAASQVNLTPSELQAITWLVYRRIHKI